MALRDIEQEINKLSTNPKEVENLRKAAVIGLEVAIEDAERVLAQAEGEITRAQVNNLPTNTGKAYSQGIKEVLVYLRAMHSRAQKGQNTHPSTPVGD